VILIRMKEKLGLEPKFGQHLSPETKAKISASYTQRSEEFRARNRKNASKPVALYNPDGSERFSIPWYSSYG